MAQVEAIENQLAEREEQMSQAEAQMNSVKEQQQSKIANLQVETAL